MIQNKKNVQNQLREKVVRKCQTTQTESSRGECEGKLCAFVHTM